MATIGSQPDVQSGYIDPVDPGCYAAVVFLVGAILNPYPYGVGPGPGVPLCDWETFDGQRYLFVGLTPSTYFPAGWTFWGNCYANWGTVLGSPAVAADVWTYLDQSYQGWQGQGWGGTPAATEIIAAWTLAWTLLLAAIAAETGSSPDLSEDDSNPDYGWYQSCLLQRVNQVTIGKSKGTVTTVYGYQGTALTPPPNFYPQAGAFPARVAPGNVLIEDQLSGKVVRSQGVFRNAASLPWL